MVGMGGSDDIKIAQTDKITGGFESLLNEAMDLETAKEMKTSFKSLEKSAKGLGFAGQVSQGSIEKFDKMLVKTLKESGMDEFSADQLLTSMIELSDTVGMNEEDMKKLRIAIAEKLNKKVLELAGGAASLTKSTQNTKKPMTNLFDEVRAFNKSLMETRNQFKLKKGLSEIFEKEAVGLF